MPDLRDHARGAGRGGRQPLHLPQLRFAFPDAALAQLVAETLPPAALPNWELACTSLAYGIVEARNPAVYNRPSVYAARKRRQ
jgi:hypothetical protein